MLSLAVLTVFRSMPPRKVLTENLPEQLSDLNHSKILSELSVTKNKPSVVLKSFKIDMKVLNSNNLSFSRS